MHAKAFSLIGLMVVIAIVALLAAVAIPAYSKYMITSKLSTAINVLHTFEDENIEYFNEHGNFQVSNFGGGGTTVTMDPQTTYLNEVQYYTDIDHPRSMWILGRLNNELINLPTANGTAIIILIGYNVNSDTIEVLCGQWADDQAAYVDLEFLPSGCKDTNLDDYQEYLRLL